jgi:hypothetical protein
MSIFAKSIPPAPPSDIVAWAVENLKVDGHSFDPERAPQIVEPIRSMFDLRTSIATLVKPVQAGGSTAGEIVAAAWCRFNHRLIQFNWQDDLKAKDRWKDRILPVLMSTPGLKWGGNRFVGKGADTKICEATFANCTIRAQGVIAKGALDSDTVSYQINEEIHLWAEGLLDKARRRQTRIYGAKAFDISNAGDEEGQLDLAWREGTMERWYTFCPGCKQYHRMHFDWDENNPQLGGLRFDTSAGRTKSGPYNFSALIPTIRYQMPCGFVIRDHPSERRLPGKYISENANGMPGKRSFNYDAVCCHEIKWPELVGEWLKAVRARKNGDPEPLRKFIIERRCVFYGENSIPFNGQIVINKGMVKSRNGISEKERAARFWSFDRQKGYKGKGETPHFWLVIRDFANNADSLLVWEGLCQTENDVLSVLNDHGCVFMQGCGDCTWDRDNMLSFAYHSGFNGLTASAQAQFFTVKDELGKPVKRIWSEPEPLHRLLNTNPKFNYRNVYNELKKIGEHLPDPREPRHWSYHKVGVLKLLFFLRSHVQVAGQNGIKWDVPGDASDDYKKHMGAWEVVVEPQGKTKQIVEQYRQLYKNDHMLQCEGYIAMMAAMSGILGRRLGMLGIQDTLLGVNSEGK